MQVCRPLYQNERQQQAADVTCLFHTFVFASFVWRVLGCKFRVASSWLQVFVWKFVFGLRVWRSCLACGQARVQAQLRSGLCAGAVQDHVQALGGVAAQSLGGVAAQALGGVAAQAVE